MILRYVFCSGGLGRMHSPDIEDMRRAIATEYLEERGPDGVTDPARQQTRSEKTHSPG